MNTLWTTLLGRERRSRALAALALPALLPFALHGTRTLSAPVPATVPAGAPIHLSLSAARRQTVRDAQGQAHQTWQPLADGAPVQPGATLRYTLRVENAGPKAVKNFVLTQPVPVGVELVPASVTVGGADAVQTAFRVDGEAGWSAAPTVAEPQPDGTVRRVPAPARAYRAVRWTFAQPLAPGQTAETVYTEKVR